jgi:hypothetical protein
MRIDKFNIEEHKDIIDSWCDGWKMSRFPDWWLPETGFIAENTLAAFMYKTDSGVAYIECVISNPEKPHKERNAAMRDVNTAIEDEAKRLGFRVLLGLTANYEVAKASEEEGYQVTKPKYAILKKELGA